MGTVLQANGSPPGRDGGRDGFVVAAAAAAAAAVVVVVLLNMMMFSVLSTQQLCGLVTACLAFVCTIHTEIVAHVKDPCPPFNKRRPYVTGTARSYLCECLQLYTPSHTLRSTSDTLRLPIHRI